MSTESTPPNKKYSQQKSSFVKMLSEPLSQYGWPSWLVYLLSLIGGIYILNPSFGVLELIPDNLPIIGNLDEGAAVMLLLAGIVEFLEGRKREKQQVQRGKQEKATAETVPGKQVDKE